MSGSILRKIRCCIYSGVHDRVWGLDFKLLKRTITKIPCKYTPCGHISCKHLLDSAEEDHNDEGSWCCIQKSHASQEAAGRPQGANFLETTARFHLLELVLALITAS